MRKFFREHSRIITILAPAVFGGIYLLLCVGNIQNSVWFDEAYSSYLARFNFGEIWNYTAVDVHPPLYYFLLKLWSMIFGNTDFALRMLSALLGAVAIVLAFHWVKHQYGKGAAVLSALFLAISPCLVRYGDEMRMYTLVTALVFGAMCCLQLAMETGAKKWWVAYGVILALGMYTHYFCALAWIANVVYLAMVYKKKFWQKPIILTHVLAVVLYIPWLPYLIKQSAGLQGGGFWIGELSLAKIGHFLSETFIYTAGGEVKNWLVVLLLATLIAFVVLSIRYRKKIKYLLCMTIVPVVALVLLSMPPLRPIFVPRYVLYSSVMVAIIMAVDILLFAREIARKKKQRKVRAVLCVLCVGLFVGSSIFGVRSVYALGNYNFDTYSNCYAKEVYTEVIENLDQGQGLPILVDNDEWMLYYNLSQYSLPEHPVYFAEEMIAYEYGSHEPMKHDLAYGGKIVDLDAFLAEHEKIILIGHTGENAMQFPREDYRLAEYFAPSYRDNDTSGYIVAIFERVTDSDETAD